MKFVIKFFTVIIFVCLYWTVLYGCEPKVSNIKANHLYGKVVAEDYGAPLSNATIVVYKNVNDEKKVLARTKSDENGFFQIKNLPADKYTITASREQFAVAVAILKLKNTNSQIIDEEIIFRLNDLCDGFVKVQKIEKVNKKQMAKRNFCTAEMILENYVSNI